MVAVQGFRMVPTSPFLNRLVSLSLLQRLKLGFDTKQFIYHTISYQSQSHVETLLFDFQSERFETILCLHALNGCPADPFCDKACSARRGFVFLQTMDEWIR